MGELEALKPGNVHIFADGHGMTVQDFMLSAEAASQVIAKPELSLGQRILLSVEATQKAVHCNTNLGIILLCAPIFQAMYGTKDFDLQIRLSHVLSTTTLEDAEALFKAIRLANPGGLGNSDVHDVNSPATCNLLQAMQASAERDFIGLQYQNGFWHLFQEGLPAYQKALNAWDNPTWATTYLYLFWLSHYPDSHVIRKYGMEVAMQLQQDAVIHYNAFKDIDNPRTYLSQLLVFDQKLKQIGINPGTSADLTVAILLINNCLIDAQ